MKSMADHPNPLELNNRATAYNGGRPREEGCAAYRYNEILLTRSPTSDRAPSAVGKQGGALADAKQVPASKRKLCLAVEECMPY
jgi:hypothetical protein